MATADLRLNRVAAETGDRPDEDRDADLERLKDLASEAPVIRLVNSMITRAVEMRASDIHIESAESGLRLRYRIDGVLREMEPPPAGLKNAIISRVKIMAKLNIAERRLAQDGRIRQAVRGKEIDFRVSMTPSEDDDVLHLACHAQFAGREGSHPPREIAASLLVMTKTASGKSRKRKRTAGRFA